MSKKITRTQLAVIIVLPALLLALLVGVTQHLSFSNIVERQQHFYGEATASQLSEHFAAHLLEDDILSINVLAKRFTDTQQLAFIAVYDGRANLLAQSGRESDGHLSFTHEITFQDSLVGSIRIVLADPPGLPLWLPVSWLLALALLAGGCHAFVSRQQNGIDLEAASPAAAPAKTNEPVLLVPDGPDEECILVVRIRPARYLERHFSRFFEAAGLYQGIVEQTSTEELVIHFEGPDASYRASCAGLLIRQLARLIGGRISFGGTLNMIGDDPERIRKAASYLASIAEGELLLAGEPGSLCDRAQLQSFHHSLVDSKDVRRITSVISQQMLEDQAMELSAG